MRRLTLSTSELESLLKDCGDMKPQESIYKAWADTGELVVEIDDAVADDHK